MFKNILSRYRKFTEYGIYLFIMLILLDITSTYIGIKYFNAYEANEKTARLFNLFGIIPTSGFKIVTSIVLCYIIKIVWKKSESLLFNTSRWLNSVAIISNLNIMFVIVSLNVVYINIVIHNINIIYRYI